MADNYQFLTPTTPPVNTALAVAAAKELPDGAKAPKVLLYAADGSPLLGREAAAGSVPVALSDEDLAKLEAIRALLAAGASVPATLARFVGLGTGGQVVKNSAGVLRGYALFNAASAARFVKIYNQPTAPSHTDTPAMTILLPAGGGANLDSAGITFSAGIGIRASTGAGDNDTGAPSANEVLAQVWYV